MTTRSVRYWILAADFLWLLGALPLAIGLHYAGSRTTIDFSAVFRAYALLVPPAFMSWTLLYFEMSLDGFKGGWNLPAILSKIVVAISLLVLVLLAATFLTKGSYSTGVLLYFSLFLALGLIGLRCIARFVVSSQLRNSDRRCVLLGDGPIAREFAIKIASHPELPFQVVGFLFPSQTEAFNGFTSSDRLSLQTLQIVHLLEQHRVNTLIVAMEHSDRSEIRKLIDVCRKAGIRVYVLPQWYDLYISKAELIEIDGLPLFSVQEYRAPSITLGLKRVLDLILSTGVLIFVSPVLTFAALVVYRVKGKAFRTEPRCGKDGARFRMWRLNIDRYTTNSNGYERFLIRWSLTELPQLWNVLRGDMSLVGPRPESPERVATYSEWQRQRLK